MDPGGSNQGIGYPRSACADYGIVPESAEFTNSGSNSPVHEQLECHICMNPMYPAIHQCPNGHGLCVMCMSKVNVCPICLHELGNTKRLALKILAESLDICQYKIYGCLYISTYPTRLQHEQNCRFRPYYCPYAASECAVTGDIQYLVAHLRDDHKVDMHDSCTFNIHYVISNPQEVENGTWTLKVFNCFGHQFCLHFEAFNLELAPVYMVFLLFMGNDNDAKKFSYSLEVGGSARKLRWQGVPRSIHDSPKTVRDSLDGLIIQKSMARFFSGGDVNELTLRVVGCIWREPL